MNINSTSKRPSLLSILSLFFLVGALAHGGLVLALIALHPARRPSTESPVLSSIDVIMTALAGSHFFKWALIATLAALIAKEFWHKKGFTLGINAISLAVLWWAGVYWSLLAMGVF